MTNIIIQIALGRFRQNDAKPRSINTNDLCGVVEYDEKKHRQKAMIPPMKVGMTAIPKLMIIASHNPFVALKLGGDKWFTKKSIKFSPLIKIMNGLKLVWTVERINASRIITKMIMVSLRCFFNSAGSFL